MADENKVTIQVEGDGAGFKNLSKEVSDGIGDIAGAVKGLTGFVASFGEALVAAFSVEKIAEFAKGMAELGSQTQRAAQFLGASTHEVALLDAAARGSSTTLESMVSVVGRLGSNLAIADGGGRRAQAALQALNLTTGQLANLSTVDRLKLIADRLSVIKDGAEKDAIGTALLGNEFKNLLPLLNQGAEGIERYADMVKRAGSEATPEFLAAAQRMDEIIVENNLSWRGLGQSIFTIAEPALSGLAKIMVDLVQQLRESISQGGLFYYVLQTLVSGVKILATALVIAIGAIETLWNVTKDVVFAMGESFMALGRIIKDVFTFNWSDIKTAWSDLQTQLQARAKISATNMEDIFQRSVGQLKTIWQSAADEHVKIEQNKNSKLAIVNQQAVSERLRLIQLEYQNRVQAINAEYGNVTISEGRKTAALYAALEQRRNEELRVAGLTAQQKLVIEQKYQNDRQKLSLGVMRFEEQQWNQFFGALQGSFNGQLRGLLAGTVSFGQAFKAVLGDMTIYFIQLLEKWAFEWLAHQIAMTVTQQGQAATRVATETAAQEAALPAKAAGFLSDLTARAALVFAGVFANLAPFIGPAAAGPAAASQAAVMAQAAAVPKFAEGTDYVLRSGLAYIHEGERITPADVAQGSGPYTGGGGGRGGDTFVIQAIDATHMDNWIKRQGRTLAKVVSKNFGSNPSVRPAT